MPSVFAILKVHADKVDEASKALGQMAEHVRSTEPGNQAYVFHQRKDDPTVFLAYEEYVDDAAFEAHGKNLASQGAKLAGLFDGPPEIAVCEHVG